MKQRGVEGWAMDFGALSLLSPKALPQVDEDR